MDWSEKHRVTQYSHALFHAKKVIELTVLFLYQQCLLASSTLWSKLKPSTWLHSNPIRSYSLSPRSKLLLNASYNVVFVTLNIETINHLSPTWTNLAISTLTQHNTTQQHLVPCGSHEEACAPHFDRCQTPPKQCRKWGCNWECWSEGEGERSGAVPSSFPTYIPFLPTHHLRHGMRPSILFSPHTILFPLTNSPLLTVCLPVCLCLPKLTFLSHIPLLTT